MAKWFGSETFLSVIHHSEFFFVLPLGPSFGAALGLELALVSAWVL